jgi:carbamate kinase
LRVVIALGGNALVRRGEAPEAGVMQRNIAAAAVDLAEIAAHHEVIVTHGNGPQIGLLALQAEAYPHVPPYPLDVLGAESEGMIGYLIEREIANHLAGREICSLLTRVVVDPQDPAFGAPDKPIGPVYDRATVQELAAQRGWTVAQDGDHYRRVVASPLPQRILEIRAIRLLVEQGVTVVCAGGGGIPVVLGEDGALAGAEAVIDKDWTSALLAREVKADVLLLLTDVDAVYREWGTADQRPIRRARPAALRGFDFAPGSMGPKVAAARAFAEAAKGFAGIGRLDQAPAVLQQRVGTIVTREAQGITLGE